MALQPSTRLGPYEIISSIGAGGMGEVYRARDTRLDRTVAIKILPENLSGNSQARERFEREARVISGLSHPHICALYDVGHQDGIDYLVMEYLEGETLAHRLKKGPLPPDQVLQYAIQITDALDTAHRHDVIHRDLKPGNIMLNKTGTKLLDFGLAKVRAAEAVAGLTALPTQTTPLTGEGTILGTLQYMAPEQLEGKEADARSDIFGFGAVLYEMLTGRRAFEGTSQASVIAAILERDPPSVAGVVPAALDRVLRRCLNKHPDDRWQTARDLKAELDWIAESGSIAAFAKAPKGTPWRERAAWITAAAMFATLALLLLLAPWRGRPPSGSDVVRFAVYPPVGTVFSGSYNTTVPVPQFALSPDGHAIVFDAAALGGATPMLWLRSLAEVTAHPLRGTEDASRPFWSTDSRWVGFFAQGKLKKMSSAGGAVQVVAEGVPDARGGTWSRDNTILFADGNNGLYRVPAASGPVTSVTRLASRAEGTHRWPQFLPDDHHFLFTIRGGEQGGVFAGSLDGKTKKLLVRVDSSALYASPGYLLWLDGDTLLAQAFDADRLELTDQPFAVAEGVGRSSASDVAISASHTGTLAYAGAILQHGRLTWFDRSGNSLDSVGADGDYPDFRLSPDEKRLAVSFVDPKTNNTDIWVTDLARGGTFRFTFGQFNAAAVWSPDGARLLFRTTRGGLIEFYEKSALGGGNEEPVLAADVERAAGTQAVNLVPTDCSADGRYIIFSVPEIGSGFNLWLLPRVRNAKPVRFLGSAADEMHGNFSPDGKFVAYSSNESGRFEVYVETFPRSDQKWPVSTNGGYEPRWRADGREIYYLAADRKLMAVPVGAGPLFDIPKVLFQTRVPAGVHANRTHYVATRDGRRFLINTQSGEPAPNPITIVLNWTAGPKR